MNSELCLGKLLISSIGPILNLHHKQHHCTVHRYATPPSGRELMDFELKNDTTG